MSFSLDRLRELASDGPVARVVVAATQGSVPREVGAEMLVTAGGPEGTIGGGALEFEAIERARGALENGTARFDRMPLGPSLGQCCGGSVSVLIEVWSTDRLGGIEGETVARALPGVSTDEPFAVSRLLAAARAKGEAAPTSEAAAPINGFALICSVIKGLLRRREGLTSDLDVTGQWNV